MCEHSLLNVEVAWPVDIDSDLAKFYEVTDCRQMCIVLVYNDAPYVNEEAFVDRHDNHSLNYMFVCILYYVSARYDISQSVSIQMTFHVASIS